MGKVKRVNWLAILSALLLIATAASQGAQASKKVYRLLLIDAEKGEPYKTFRENLISELAGFGYRKDDSLQIVYYALDNYEDRALEIWRHRESEKRYDAICLSGTITCKAFKKIADANQNIGFIFACVTDPIGLGLIDSFETLPMANFTGVCYPIKVNERLRFIKKTMPNVKNIGLVHSQMPQSISYNQWLKNELQKDEFKDLKISFRSVPFVKSAGGHKRMALLAKKHVLELDSQVDVFLSAHDQMGVQEPYSRMIYETAHIPLVGVGKKEVIDGWGATMTITPSLADQGRQVAVMIKKVFEGKSVKEIQPQWPENYEVAFDLKKVKAFGLQIPKELLKKAEAGNNIVY